jgi:hypothetical protein
MIAEVPRTIYVEVSKPAAQWNQSSPVDQSALPVMTLAPSLYHTLAATPHPHSACALF